VTAAISDAKSGAISIVRGFVHTSRVVTEAPEPDAVLYQVAPGDTAEKIVRQHYAGFTRHGHDLRYFENVLLRVNQETGRKGVAGTGGRDIRLVEGERIWLVSPGHAAKLEPLVASGSYTGGKFADAKDAYAQYKDRFRDVWDSMRLSPEVAGEYADILAEHWDNIVETFAVLFLLEKASWALASTPVVPAKLVGLGIQCLLMYFAGKAAVQSASEATAHGGAWIDLAWNAATQPASLRSETLKAASDEFTEMALQALLTCLSLGYIGFKVFKAPAFARHMAGTKAKASPTRQGTRTPNATERPANQQSASESSILTMVWSEATQNYVFPKPGDLVAGVHSSVMAPANSAARVATVTAPVLNVAPRAAPQPEPKPGPGLPAFLFPANLTTPLVGPGSTNLFGMVGGVGPSPGPWLPAAGPRSGIPESAPRWSNEWVWVKLSDGEVYIAKPQGPTGYVVFEDAYSNGKIYPPSEVEVVAPGVTPSGGAPDNIELRRRLESQQKYIDSLSPGEAKAMVVARGIKCETPQDIAVALQNNPLPRLPANDYELTNYLNATQLQKLLKRLQSQQSGASGEAEEIIFANRLTPGDVFSVESPPNVPLLSPIRFRFLGVQDGVAAIEQVDSGPEIAIEWSAFSGKQVRKASGIKAAPEAMSEVELEAYLWKDLLGPRRREVKDNFERGGTAIDDIIGSATGDKKPHLRRLREMWLERRNRTNSDAPLKQLLANDKEEPARLQRPELSDQALEDLINTDISFAMTQSGGVRYPTGSKMEYSWVDNAKAMATSPRILSTTINTIRNIRRDVNVIIADPDAVKKLSLIRKLEEFRRRRGWDFETATQHPEQTLQAMRQRIAEDPNLLKLYLEKLGPENETGLGTGGVRIKQGTSDEALAEMLGKCKDEFGVTELLEQAYRYYARQQGARLPGAPSSQKSVTSVNDDDGPLPPIAGSAPVDELPVRIERATKSMRDTNIWLQGSNFGDLVAEVRELVNGGSAQLP